MRLPGTFALVAMLAACSDGGGASATPAAGPGADAPALHLLFDAAAGRPYLLQAEVALAVLELREGGTTGNLLPAPVTVTFAEPSGGVRGLTLPRVPAGDYTQLRLALTPGSARLAQDGAVAPLDAPADLAIPLAGRMLHAVAPSWLAIGHLGGDQVVAGGGRAAWTPQLVGRLDDSPLSLAGLVPHRVDGVDLLATRADGGAALRLQFAVDCAYFDGLGRAIATRSEFLAAADATAEVAAAGALLRAGVLYARSARLQPRRVEALLHGCVLASDPAQQRVRLRVDAEDLLGRLRPVPSPYEVDVRIAGAWLHESGQAASAPGWPCSEGRLLVVRVAARAVVGGAVELTADEVVVVPPQGAPPTLEWHARVTAVDALAGTIAVDAAPFVPLVVAGEPVAAATVLVDARTTIWRRELQGQGQYAVPLETVQPGVDRIWWRGVPLGNGAVRADFVRVRTE